MSAAIDLILGRRRELREELKRLDTPDHALQIDQRRLEMVDALREERRGVEQRLRVVSRVPDQVRVDAGPWVPPHERPTAGAERARLEAQLISIGNEITRLESGA